MIGVSRRLSHRVRIEWQNQREAGVAAAKSKKEISNSILQRRA
jgi:hypothetical protein